MIANQHNHIKMGKFNKDFRLHRAFDILTLFAFIIFFAFFTKSIIIVMEAFETEVYSNTIAEISRMNN